MNASIRLVIVQCFYLSTWWEYVIRTSLSDWGYQHHGGCITKTLLYFALTCCPSVEVSPAKCDGVWQLLTLNQELDAFLKLLFSVRQFGMSWNYSEEPPPLSFCLLKGGLSITLWTAAVRIYFKPTVSGDAFLCCISIICVTNLSIWSFVVIMAAL